MRRITLFLVFILMLEFFIGTQNIAHATSTLPRPPVCEFTGKIINLLDKYQLPTIIEKDATNLEINIESTGKQLRDGDAYYKDIFKGCSFFNQKTIKAYISDEKDRQGKFKIGDEISGELWASGYSNNTLLTVNNVYNIKILNTKITNDQDINVNTSPSLPTTDNQSSSNPSTVNKVELQWWNPISWIRVLWSKIF